MKKLSRHPVQVTEAGQPAETVQAAEAVQAEETAQASEVAAGLERLVSLIRWLSPAGLSLTSGATLATLEQSGPWRLTALAAKEGVTQPAMTQLVGRLSEAGLAERCPDPEDGRVVHVQITEAGREFLAGRRAIRAERLSSLLTRLSQADQDALAAALPAIRALASVDRDTAGSFAQN